jgi:tetratricopeptide (TPR) repeat protein
MSFFKDLAPLPPWGEGYRRGQQAHLRSALALLGLCLCLHAAAQRAVPDAATQQLQQLLDAQHTATQSGDAAQVASTSQKLTELATQQISAVSAALKQPDLTAARSGQFKVREHQLRQILSTSFNDWGTAEARQQQYQQALAHFQQAEKWDAATPGLMRNLGTAAFFLGDYPESVRALKTVVNQNSAQNLDDQRARLMLAMSLFSIEKFADAANQFALISELAMQDTRTAYAWAFSLARTNQQQKANQIVDALAVRDLAPDVRMLVCQLYNLTENYEHAVPCFRKLADENPTMLRAHFEMGATLVHLDRPADAIPELRAELKLNPQDVDTQYYLAFALLETSQKEEAMPLLRTVIAEQPGYSQAQYQLGKALLEDGKTDEAIQHLEIAAKLEPASDYIHYQLQAAYRRAGRTDDANRELQIYKEIKASHRGVGASHENSGP